jgi:hypothetical protein
MPPTHVLMRPPRFGTLLTRVCSTSRDPSASEYTVPRGVPLAAGALVTMPTVALADTHGGVRMPKMRPMPPTGRKLQHSRARSDPGGEAWGQGGAGVPQHRLGATWGSSAPIKPLIDAHYPRNLRAFVGVSKWAVLVGTVDYAICAGNPGGRVTAANVGFPSSVVLFFVGLVVSGTQFVHCGAGPNDDCTTLMGCAALSVASLCAALWLNFREMPRLSEAWCAQAAARLRAEIPELQAAAPQLEFEIAALSPLAFALHASPTREALQQQRLASKLGRSQSMDAVRQSQQGEQERPRSQPLPVMTAGPEAGATDIQTQSNPTAHPHPHLSDPLL